MADMTEYLNNKEKAEEEKHANHHQRNTKEDKIMGSKDMFEISARVLRQNADTLIITEDEEVYVELPQSEVEHDLETGETGRIKVPEWLAIKKELV